jgi:hypothetical protein
VHAVCVFEEETPREIFRLVSLDSIAKGRGYLPDGHRIAPGRIFDFRDHLCIGPESFRRTGKKGRELD